MSRISGTIKRGAALASVAALAAGLTTAMPATAADDVARVPVANLPVIGLTSDDGIVVIRNGETDRRGTVETGDGDLVGIDVRPSNGRLYGIVADGRRARVVRINPANAAVTDSQVLRDFANRPIRMNADQYGADFNPMADRLRVVGTNGQNLRINVETGLTLIDGPLRFGKLDRRPVISSVAYTNSRRKTPAATSMYVLENGLNVLAEVDPPNNGVVKRVGKLGVTADDMTGFDIAARKGGNTAVVSTRTLLGTDISAINLRTGEVGDAVSNTFTFLDDLTVPLARKKR